MTDVDTFVALLGETCILQPQQLSAIKDDLRPRLPEVRSLARELVRRGWLTPYQVNQVAGGKLKNLMLGPYLLLERLGAGGMGQVYKARHLYLNRLAALKIIRGDRLGAGDSEPRFRREMQAAAQLDHPNIVHAFDAGQIHDGFFLAMEYVEGINLRQLVLEQGRLGKRRACDYIRQAALGLQHAHERGLVHRDVKPSNLLLAGRGSVLKILDLGLARVHPALLDEGAGADLTQKGSLIGTKDYVAPEQITDPSRVDRRADLYSLGCTFYHLLTGRVPFPADTPVAKLLKHMRENPPPIESLRPSISPALGAVVRRLMAKRPEDRFASAAELASALTPSPAPVP